MAIKAPTPPTGAWKTIKGIIADTIGPMAILGIAAQKFVSASKEAATNAQRMQEVLAASDGASKLRMQFEQLLGSATAARKQVEMLAKVASSGAFSFEALGEASKNLQVLTNGALNSQKGLKQVEDAAAATGAPVDAMATAVGQLYSALKENRGVEQSAKQLQQLGAISQETVQKLKGLSDAGVSISASWQTVEADLKKAAGAASVLGGTLAGLEAQIQAIRQQSDVRIGDMFIEAELAAKQAEIGFEKFKAAVAEANAGPWAALQTQIGGVKKAVGDLAGAMAQTGAVKSAFEAVAGVAVAVLGGLVLGLMAAIPMLLKFAGVLGGTAVAALSKFAASVGISTAAVVGMAKALRGVLFNPLTVFLTVVAGLFINLAAKAHAAAKSIQELKKSFRSLQAERKQGYGDARADSTARTPEERDAGIKAARDRIAQSDERKRQIQEQIKKEQEFRAQSFLGIPTTSIDEREASEKKERMLRGQLDAEENFQDFQRNAIEDLAGNPMAADQELLKVSQERLKLEQQILEAAKDRLLSSVSPDAAVKLAEQNMQTAEKEMDYAKNAQKNRYEDNQKLSDAARKFEESRGARDKYVADVDNKIKTGREEILAAAPTSQQFEVNRAIENNDFGELRRQVKIGALDKGMVEEYIQAVEAKQKNPSGPALDFDAFNTGAASDSGKIQAEIAKRAALQQEERDLLRNKDFAGVEKVRAKMSELVNPLTGESELSGNKEAQALQKELQAAQAAGNEKEVNRINRRLGEVASASMGVSDQRLQTDLKNSSEKEDTVAKQAALEEARVKGQAAKVAAAAAKGEIDAANKRLALEREIAALKGGSDAAEKKAIEKEYQDSVAKTAEKRSALEQQDAAAKAYNEMLNSADVKSLPGDPNTDTEAQKTIRAQLEAARAAFEAAQANAAEKGVQAGDSKESYDLKDKTDKERRDAAERAQVMREASRKGRNRDALFDARSQGIGRDTSAAERGARAMAEAGSRVGTLLAAESLAKDLDAANAKGDAKSAEQAKVGLAGLGFEGKGLDEIREIMAVEMQVLQIKMQQAQIDQTASQKRHQDAMQALRVEQQRVQLTLNQAQGKNSGVTGWQLEEKELMRKKGELESALPIAREKEQVTVQAEAANALAGLAANMEAGKIDQKGMDDAINNLPDGVRQAVQALQSAGGPMDAKSLNAQAQALTARRNQLENQLAAAGVSGQSADEIREELGNVATQIEQNSANRALNREQTVRNQRIAMLETQEQFGTADQREAAKAERKRLQDEGTMRSRKQDYIDNQGMDEKEAGALAKAETERDRLVSDMNEAGNARVDSLTAVGGGATGFMGGMKDKDAQERIAKLNEEIKGILQNIEKKTDSQIRMSERVLSQEIERP